MRRDEINNFKASNRSIHLNTAKFITGQHSSLSSTICIRGYHDKFTLTIGTATKIEIHSSDPVDLKKRNILILDPTQEGHERLYEIEINAKTQRIELKKLHDEFHDLSAMKIVCEHEIGGTNPT